MSVVSRTLLKVALGILIALPPLYAKAGTIIQSATGLSCSSNCINGVCTNTCTDNGAMFKGNGDITTKVLAFNNFTSIRVSNIEFQVQRSKVHFVNVEADSNLFENVIVTQNKQQLDISLKQGSYDNASFTVTVGMPAIETLNLQGVEGGLISGFEQDEIALHLQGIANLSGDNNVFKALHYSGNGVTTLDFSKTKVENVRLDVDGTSDVLLSFPPKSGVLAGNVQGVSSVVYCGNPENQIQARGVTNIQRIDC